MPEIASTCCPSGENAADHTRAGCSSAHVHSPEAADHTLEMPLPEIVSTNCPSRENADDST
eukprot:8115405-Pyramimonas_sp.AAC.1